MIIAALLGLIVGLLAGGTSLWFLVLAGLLLACYALTRKWRQLMAALLLFALGLTITLLYSRPVLGMVSTWGFVTRTSSSYFLLTTYRGTFYVDSDLNPGLGSIMRVSGVGQLPIFAKFDGDFDFAAYLRRQGCFTMIEDGQVEPILKIPDLAGTYRNWCLQRLEGEQLALVSSFLFAKGGGGIEDYDELQRGGVGRFLTGTSLHLSFLSRGLEKIFKGKKTGIISPLLALFICFTSDFSLSGRRVFTLALMRYLAKRTNWFRDRGEAQALGGIILLAGAPFAVTDMAFFFPFLMIFLSACARGLYSRLRPPLRQLISSGLSFLFLVPPLLWEHGSLNILGAFFALVLVFPSCFLYLTFIPLYFLPLAGVYAGPLASGYLKMLRWLGGIGVLDLGAVGLVFTILWYVILIVFLILIALGVRRAWLCLIGLVALLVLTPIQGYLPKTEVIFIDVGQGDSTLVVNRGKAVLIDTGGSRYDDLATACLIPLLKRERISRLEAVILTHDDFDHSGALESLLANFPVGEVIRGEEIGGAFTAAGVEFYDHNFLTGTGDDNESSAVLSFTLDGRDYLIMGDAPKEVEAEIIQRGDDLDADILRIGHHGSKTSTSSALLEAVTPNLAVISCGKNYYGHPTSEVLNLLESYQIPVWRTDLDGSLKLS